LESGRGKTSSALFLVLFAVLLPGVASPISPDPEPHPNATLATPDAETGQETEDKRLTVAGLEEMLGFLKDRAANEDSILKDIHRLGVRFFADQTTMDELRAKGATEPILKLITQIAPVRPKTGSLAVRCAPAECEIKLNDRPDISTVNGRFVKADLPVGEVIVNFKKEGYFTEQRIVQVAVEPGPEVSVTLEPNNVTKAQNGKRLFALMLGALGLDSEGKNFPPLTCSGSITSYTGGKQSTWNFYLRIGSPSLIEMTATSSAGSLIYQCNGERCSEKKKGHFPLVSSKGIQPAAAEALEVNLRAFAQYHLGPILQRLLSRSMRPSAPTAEDKPEADQHLRAEFDDSVFNVTLGPDLLPTLLEYESKGDLGSGLKILFGDYVNIAGGEKPKNGGVLNYPKRTTIRLPDAEQNGPEVWLDYVELWSTFRAGDLGK
jgi:hypothetical protein